MSNPESLLQRALQLHQSGQLAQAESLYNQLLAENPNHAQALHFLGVLALQRQQLPQAIELIERSLALAPDSPEALNNLGNALKAAGKLPEAIAAFQKSIALAPTLTSAHFNLGLTHLAHKQFDQAIAAFTRALALNPNHSAAHFHLADALRLSNRFAEALLHYQDSLALQPNNPDAHNNLGITHLGLQNLPAAVASFRTAIAVNPNYAPAYNNLSFALYHSHDFHSALQSANAALRIDPNYLDAHINFALAALRLNQPRPAVQALERALEINPASTLAASRLIEALMHTHELDKAAGIARQLCAGDPSNPSHHIQMGDVYRMQGNAAAAVPFYNAAQKLLPDAPEIPTKRGHALIGAGLVREAITDLRAATELDPTYTPATGHYLMALHFDTSLPEQQLFAIHKKWGDRIAPKSPPAPWNLDRNPQKRLRVGFLSPDFCAHSVATFFEPLFHAHMDRNNLEIFLYSSTVHADFITARFRSRAHHFIDAVPLGNNQLEEQIRKDRIDILLDLAGHTDSDRLLLFARKPAPIQIAYLGHIGTTGLPQIDCRLTDIHLDPPELNTQQFYTEKLLRLPETFACYQPPDHAPPVNELPALTGRGVTFASLNVLAKIHDALLDTWATLLTRVPNSRLLIVSFAADQPDVQERIRLRLTRRGVDPARLHFRGNQPFIPYLQLHNEIDILLDTFPVNGHTVTCHALYMGVPTVTLAGHTYRGRLSTSVLTNLELQNLIAATPDQYIEIAATLAADLPRLAALRRTMRERMQSSPLMNPAKLASEVESLYHQLWRQYLQ